MTLDKVFKISSAKPRAISCRICVPFRLTEADLSARPPDYTARFIDISRQAHNGCPTCTILCKISQYEDENREILVCRKSNRQFHHFRQLERYLPHANNVIFEFSSKDENLKELEICRLPNTYAQNYLEQHELC